MVSSIIGTSLSGLQAAQSRLNASAGNIANQFSDTQRVNGETVNSPYQPIESVQISQQPSGVRSELRPQLQDPLLRFQPDSSLADEDGFIALPNVDQAGEVVNQILATNAFQANLQIIEAEDERLGAALDILE